MKYLSFLIMLAFASCQAKQSPTIISADISNIDVDEITISGFDFKKKVKVNEGKINDTLDIKDSGLYIFSFARNRSRIYLNPGDAINVVADASDFRNTVKITSPNTAKQNYLDKQKNIERDVINRAAFKIEAEDFLTIILTVNDSLTAVIESSGADIKFQDFEKQNLAYDLAKYKTLYAAYSDNAKKEDTLFTHSIALDNESEYLASPNYKDLVSTMFSVNMVSDTTLTYEENFMDNISALKPGNIKDQLLYGDMRYLMGPNENLDKMYEFFKTHSGNDENNAVMLEKFEALKKLAAGENSPKFDYENYAGGKTKLDDLKGKYVYVDVWATWCGPCLGEIPSLKKVEKKYHDKNIEFVSISIDDKKDHSKWGDMITEKELGGVQLFADNAWQSEFVQDYKINGIPRFILIDPKGKIVTADAPRPSDDKLIEKFEDLKI